MHRIVCLPLRDYHNALPGTVEIRYGRGHVAILAGSKLVALQGGAYGIWPSPVTLDASELSKLRFGREVRRIALTYQNGTLHVEVAELVPEPRYRRQPMLPFGDMPARVPVTQTIVWSPEQFALRF